MGDAPLQGPKERDGDLSTREALRVLLGSQSFDCYLGSRVVAQAGGALQTAAQAQSLCGAHPASA
jgi:hypothetical protein